MAETLAALFLVVALGVLINVRLRTLLTYFQQEEYNPRRYLGAWWKVRLFDVQATIVVILGAARGWTFVPRPYAISLVALGLLLIAWRERRYVYKKPLVMTERAKRIDLLALLMCLPLLVLAGVLPITSILAIQILPLVLILSNAFLSGHQKRLNEGFVNRARDKLAALNPVRIGITGSFGKTTVKHILAELLGASGPVFYSRGSINTVLGLTRHIRERLQPSHRYFIAEMGAYGIASIRRLCDLVLPDFGIVTAIGAAHSERFGNLEVTAQAKSELAEAVIQNGGTIVLAEQVLDFEPFQRLRQAHGGNVVVVGRGKDTDIRITSAEMQAGEWQITLSLPAGGELSYALPLLGEHNVMNSALAVGLVHVIDPDVVPQLPGVTRHVAQIPHRLQKRELSGQPLILDDAFNANETGFANAVAELRALADERGGRAILVTPGIVELGLEHDRVHEALGTLAAGRCDQIIAVNAGRIGSFVEAARSAGGMVEEAANLAEARSLLKDAKAEDVILYENDLPDILEEKRLL